MDRKSINRDFTKNSFDRLGKVTDLENTLKKIAFDSKYTSGKWFSVVPWHRADEIWQNIVQHVLSDHFSGDDVTHVLIKARHNGPDNLTDFCGDLVTSFATIMVCTTDWTDGGRTKLVGKKLMALNLDQVEWNYKPNITNLLRNDINNKNIKFPYIYSFP